MLYKIFKLLSTSRVRIGIAEESRAVDSLISGKNDDAAFEGCAANRISSRHISVHVHAHQHIIASTDVSAIHVCIWANRIWNAEKISAKSSRRSEQTRDENVKSGSTQNGSWGKGSFRCKLVTRLLSHKNTSITFNFMWAMLSLLFHCRRQQWVRKNLKEHNNHALKVSELWRRFAFVMQNSTAECSLRHQRMEARRGKNASLLITRIVRVSPSTVMSNAFMFLMMAYTTCLAVERQYPTINHARRHFTIFTFCIPLRRVNHHDSMVSFVSRQWWLNYRRSINDEAGTKNGDRVSTLASRNSIIFLSLNFSPHRMSAENIARLKRT